MPATVKAGRYAAVVDLDRGVGAVARHASGMAATPATRLDFWAYAAQATELRVSVQAQDGAASATGARVTLLRQQWTNVVAFSGEQLGQPALFKRINIQLNHANGRTVYFDQVKIHALKPLPAACCRCSLLLATATYNGASFFSIAAFTQDDHRYFPPHLRCQLHHRRAGRIDRCRPSRSNRARSRSSYALAVNSHYGAAAQGAV